MQFGFLPLQHPRQVAEERAIVDNLSQGRAGITFTPGWITWLMLILGCPMFPRLPACSIDAALKDALEPSAPSQPLQSASHTPPSVSLANFPAF